MFGGARIVVVEDDQIVGGSIVQRLEIEGAGVTWLRQAARTLSAIRTPSAPIDAVICDIRLPDGSGEDIFATLCQTSTPPPFLFITGQGEIDRAVRLMRTGAADYITKPFETGVSLDRLRLLIGPQADDAAPMLLGVSPAAREVEALMARAASGAGPVVVRGAPGTGKTRVVRRLHALSDRAAAPLIEVNLAREPDGPAALAAGRRAVGEGTLVLVGPERLELRGQDDLMVLLGSGFSGRIVATCGPDAGGLRTDLLAALAGLTIAIPPLRDRPEDAVWLAQNLLSGAAQTRPGDTPRLSALAEAAERDQIPAALERTGGHVGEAARALNVSRTTLWEKMQKLGL